MVVSGARSTDAAYRVRQADNEGGFRGDLLRRTVGAQPRWRRRHFPLGGMIDSGYR